MRVLVTGGGGFIGWHLCERLIEEGSEVIRLDHFFTGSRDNVAQLLDCPYTAKAGGPAPSARWTTRWKD